MIHGKSESDFLPQLGYLCQPKCSPRNREIGPFKLYKGDLIHLFTSMTYYTFTITYGSGRNKAVATVRVIEQSSLFDLADILLEAIGFDLDHAFGFHSSMKSPYDRNMEREYTLFADQGEANHPTDTGVQNTLINDVFDKGDTMLFHFDYGDDWMFIVKCINIETTSSRKRKPEILNVEGEFPEQYPDYEDDWEEDDVVIGINPQTGKRIDIKKKP